MFTAVYDQGVLKSINAGRTWETLFKIGGCESLPALSVHPKNLKRLLVILESG